MNGQIVFTLKELVVGILYIFAITAGLLKLALSLRKIRNNDLSSFVKTKDFEKFKEEFQNFRVKNASDISEIKTGIEYLRKNCKPK